MTLTIHTHIHTYMTLTIHTHIHTYIHDIDHTYMHGVFIVSQETFLKFLEIQLKIYVAYYKAQYDV